MVKLLIVEDTEAQAGLVRGFVSDEHTVAGWEQTAKEAISLTKEVDPDVVVMDLNLEEGNGVEGLC